MEKIYTAIGNFYNEEGTQLIDVPSDEEAIYAKVEEIMNTHPAGSTLNDEEVAIIRAYLPAIGCDEATQDGNYSLQGNGTVTKTAEGAGISVKAEGIMDVESRWEQEHDRKQWSGTMKVTRTGGEAAVKELTFDFYYLSIGMGVDGNMTVLYNEHYSRTFNDPYHLKDFNEGGEAQASRYDISKHIQWGFYMHATCRIRTDQGTLLI